VHCVDLGESFRTHISLQIWLRYSRERALSSLPDRAMQQPAGTCRRPRTPRGSSRGRGPRAKQAGNGHRRSEHPLEQGGHQG